MNPSTNSLIIVAVKGGSLGSVRVVTREPGEEDSHFLERAIYRAGELQRGVIYSICSIDEKTGIGTPEIWRGEPE